MNKEEISKRIDEGLQILKQEPSFIFNLEEIKAIEILQQEPDFSLSYYERERAIDIALNLISKLQKEVDKKDKVINLLIDDFQAENYFVNMTNKEVLEYYEKRKELK